jgi:beta-glucosidase/6-phospho-beta-glucosidase/beta-galactosidase
MPVQSAHGLTPLMAGFECSTHRTSDGSRIDIVGQTAHDRGAHSDFLLMTKCGIKTVREGLRWHLIESQRGKYNWSTVDAITAAATKERVEIIWDLLHFGFPDWVNPYHRDFPLIFADFAEAFVKRQPAAGLYVPINEISFLSWAAGDAEFMYPWSKGRGCDLKRSLCAAALEATRVIRRHHSDSMILSVEPMISVQPFGASDLPTAQRLHEAQFEAVDTLLGKANPDLGGAPEMIDIIGVNHYPHSQWYSDDQRTTISWNTADWTPLSVLLERVFDRYRKPLLLAETGAEGDLRTQWFNYVTLECQKGLSAGLPIMGICLYPILSHMAWTGERFCPNGLFDGSDRNRYPEASYLDAVLKYQRTANYLAG